MRPNLFSLKLLNQIVLHIGDRFKAPPAAGSTVSFFNVHVYITTCSHINFLLELNIILALWHGLKEGVIPGLYTERS